jgi:ketosteroid isomerase-like protein
MSAEENKRTIERYFATMASGDPTVAQLFTEDVTWWVPESSPLGGTHAGRDKVLALMANGVHLYDASTPMQVDLREMVAEGDSVCVQLVMRARTAKGEDYENHYHFAFRLREGRISSVREYVDTLYAQRKLFD